MLRIAPVVEGQGEDIAVPILLRRVLGEVVGRYDHEILRPIRRNRSEFIDEVKLSKAVGFAAKKLRNPPHGDEPGMILVLFDRDPSPEPPCQLAPETIFRIARHHSNQSFEVVVANVEYETWFVAAAESLASYIALRPNESVPGDPETRRCGKKWVRDRFTGARYSETQDQPAMTAAMDIAKARERSPSFDKLCRVLESKKV